MAAFSATAIAILVIIFTVLVNVAPIVQLYHARHGKSQAKSTSQKVLTWRLFVTEEADRKSKALEKFLTRDTLKQALENKFHISLAKSTWSLALQREHYCATVTFRRPKKSFLTGESFDLELELPEDGTISLRWVQL